MSNQVVELSREANPSITPSTSKATSWIITLNNPTETERDAWTNIKQNHFVKEANGQLEVGEEGTPHIQGFIRTESVRFAQIKKLFPRAHIEIAKNAIAAKQYCAKESTRQENLPVTELNTSIHRAVYEQTIHWYQYINTRDNGYLPITREQAITYAELWNHEMEEHTREWIYDRAVSNIIRSGVRNIEFIAVNNITRTAFIRYFPALWHREHQAALRRQELNLGNSITQNGMDPVNGQTSSSN